MIAIKYVWQNPCSKLTVVNHALFSEDHEQPVHLEHPHTWRDDDGHLARAVKVAIDVVLIKHCRGDESGGHRERSIRRGGKGRPPHTGSDNVQSNALPTIYSSVIKTTPHTNSKVDNSTAVDNKSSLFCLSHSFLIPHATMLCLQCTSGGHFFFT